MEWGCARSEKPAIGQWKQKVEQDVGGLHLYMRRALPLRFHCSAATKATAAAVSATSTSSFLILFQKVGAEQVCRRGDVGLEEGRRRLQAQA
jgi:hypothetical protein